MHWLMRRPRPLSAFGPEDLALDLTHRYWQGRRDGGLLPARSVIDTPQLRFLVPRIDWLDLSARASCAEIGLARLGSVEGAAASPDCHDRRPLGALLRSDLETVRLTGSPLLQDLVLCQAGRPEIWRMLLLPTADDGVRVREVMLLVRQPAPLTMDEPLLV